VVLVAVDSTYKIFRQGLCGRCAGSVGPILCREGMAGEVGTLVPG